MEIKVIQEVRNAPNTQEIYVTLLKHNKLQKT